MRAHLRSGVVLCLVALGASVLGQRSLPAAAEGPSPEERIVFGFGSLYSIRPDGSDQRKIVDPGDRYAYSPDVSPDGKRVVFHRWGSSPDPGELVIVDIDGANPRVVPLPGNLRLPASAAWSPDGERLAFVYEEHSDLKVGVVRTDGTGFETIGRGQSVDWAPDGSLLIENGNDISSRSTDGTERLLRRIDDGTLWYPRWSPDGTMIAFAVYRPSSPGLNTSPWIDVMNADGSGRRRIRFGQYPNHVPAWSRDSRTLVFGGIGIIDLAGRQLRDVPVYWPSWANPTGPTSCGLGYWLVGSDGGVFAFGDAGFFGSAGDVRLNRPVVGMAATPSGRGYWLAGSDGGVFAFGDAGFFGSAGSVQLNQPVVAVAPTASRRGYWLTAADGGVFNFGDAAYHGSAAALPLGAPVRGGAAMAGEDGLLLVAEDGQVVPLGAARFCGSAWQRRLDHPVVAGAMSPPAAKRV